jgi:hypothetical protein
VRARARGRTSSHRFDHVRPASGTSGPPLAAERLLAGAYNPYTAAPRLLGTRMGGCLTFGPRQRNAPPPGTPRPHHHDARQLGRRGQRGELPVSAQAPRGTAHARASTLAAAEPDPRGPRSARAARSPLPLAASPAHPPPPPLRACTRRRPDRRIRMVGLSPPTRCSWARQPPRAVPGARPRPRARPKQSARAPRAGHARRPRRARSRPLQSALTPCPREPRRRTAGRRAARPGLRQARRAPGDLDRRRRPGPKVRSAPP